MKIIYMGTPDFAVAPLEAIIKAGHQVTLVVTQPDKEKGRGKAVQFPPVKECALKYGIEVFQPVKIREPEMVSKLREYEADLFVVTAFGQILTEEILTMPKYGCINIHGSLLPKYRGAAPIQWAILDGEKTTGITIMQMDKGVDTGDMLLKSEVAIIEEDTAESLEQKLTLSGAKLVIEAIEKLKKGELTAEKQGEAATDYAKRLTKDMGRIDWSKEAAYLERLVRAMNSWPSAYTSLNGKALKIWEAEEVQGQESHQMPGTIIEVTKTTILAATGKGTLSLKQVQLEGKKRMKTDEFLRGCRIEAGMQLE